MSTEQAILAVRTALQELMDRHSGTVLISVDLWKAFDSLHMPMILKRLDKLKLSRNIVTCFILLPDVAKRGSLCNLQGFVNQTLVICTMRVVTGAPLIVLKDSLLWGEKTTGDVQASSEIESALD
ncbi:hypothetical protein ACTXT7_016963 [Hymenolepis weldensis]